MTLLQYPVRHFIPGRVRLHVPELRNRHYANALESFMGSIPGVQSARASFVSRSLVVHYEPHLAHLPGEIPGLIGTVPLPTNGHESAKVRTASPLRRIAGRSLLAAGVVGWLLPIVPGTPFVIAAVWLLGHDDPYVRYGKQQLGRLKPLAQRLRRRPDQKLLT